MSITFSEINKEGQTICLFEKLQDKIEIEDEIMELAKQKKTAFAKALLASRASGKIFGSSEETTFLSERPSTTKAGTRGRSNAVTSIANLINDP